MLPKIEISTAEFFPARKISQIVDVKYGDNESVIFKYIENTEAVLSWGEHSYIKIIKTHPGEIVFEKTETTHILVNALKVLYQYSRTTGELLNVG